MGVQALPERTLRRAQLPYPGRRPGLWRRDPARIVRDVPRPLGDIWQLRGRVARARQGVLGRMAPAALPEPEAAVVLLLAALGSPEELAQRTLRLTHALVRLLGYREVRERLERAAKRGQIAGVPTRLQLLFGGLDMLRFLFEPGAAHSDAARGISPRLHRWLRLVGDPVSWLDPGGLTSSCDEVVEHLLSDYHLNPVYDLQLLSTFEAGLDRLEREASQVLDGNHPRQARLSVRIPEPSYYGGLAAYVRAVRKDPGTPVPVIRDPGGGGNNVASMDAAARASFVAAAAQLSELWGFLDYCHALPRAPLQLLLRLRRVQRFADASVRVPCADS
jgi:hypothetical protein